MLSSGKKIIEHLMDHGYEAYLVGGCVRDILLGQEPKDIDITTNALPDDVENLFDATIPTGKAYGTITVIENGHSFEVTTYRLESDYDGRRPKVVAFSNQLIEDLSRRDFTMNAMAMGLDGLIIDPFGGQEDLASGYLKFVRDPKERIREDRIRILRYVRFLCQYQLEPADSKVGYEESVDLSNLSAERIRDEFNKILLSLDPIRGLNLLESMGLLKQFFPELSKCKGFQQHHPAHFEDVFDHTLRVLSNCDNDLSLKLAALCHDLGKTESLSFDEYGIGHFYGHQKISEDLAKAMMLRLKYPNKLIDKVTLLVRHHMRTYEGATKITAKRLIQKVGVEFLEDLFKLQIADTSACAGDRAECIHQIEAMKQLCLQVLESQEAFGLRDLKVDGNDLLAIGFKGKEIGVALKSLLECVISEDCPNEKELLITKAKSQRER